jgi:acyl-CoA reductase-like NAD-dependent aldehyde dehydrogenase
LSTSSDDLVGAVVRGSPEHVDQAVAAAKAAQSAWAARTFVERTELLAAALVQLETDIDRSRSSVRARKMASRWRTLGANS